MVASLVSAPLPVQFTGVFAHNVGRDVCFVFLRCFFLRCLCEAEIGIQNQPLQKLDRQKTLANEKIWQHWIRRVPCLIKRSARPNKCMTNNTARQREQSQDTPAWEPFNTTWPQKPAASDWNITTLWAKRKAMTKAGKTDPQNVLANSNRWQCWIWRIVKSGSSTHSANQSKNMKDNMARYIEQNDDRKAWSDISNGELSRQRGFRETRRQRWHGLSEVAINTKPDSRSGTTWVAGAKTKDPTITLVNCTGDRRRDQESDNQSASVDSVHRWQACTPTFLKLTW